jgi:hypothetical protein
VAARQVTLRPLPGVSLRVVGDPDAVAHFATEYRLSREGAQAEGPGLTVSFVPRIAHRQGRDRHKSLWWDVRLERTDGRPSELSIALHGRPRWFGLSLVQGYLVEPCLSLLAPEQGQVLLPAAGIVRKGAVDLLVGRSRTGKSSLSVRALAAGLAILGDDQVVVSSDGTCVRFPRRLRVYDDLSATAPDAAARLPIRYRLGLLARRIARLASGGRVAPSQAVPISALGTAASSPLRLGRVVLLARDADVDRPRLLYADVALAVARGLEALREQRSRLLRTIGPSLRPMLDDVTEAEGGILRAAFASVPIVAIDLPPSMDAPSAVGDLAQLLGLP